MTSPFSSLSLPPSQLTVQEMVDLGSRYLQENPLSPEIGWSCFRVLVQYLPLLEERTKGSPLEGLCREMRTREDTLGISLWETSQQLLWFTEVPLAASLVLRVQQPHTMVHIHRNVEELVKTFAQKMREAQPNKERDRTEGQLEGYLWYQLQHVNAGWILLDQAGRRGLVSEELEEIRTKLRGEEGRLRLRDSTT